MRGALPVAGLGDAVAADTRWTAKLVPNGFLTAPEYAAYSQPGQVKLPFFLQPDTHYVGAAWFQREIYIPHTWAGRHAVVSLERPHWETRMWIDGRHIGRNDSLHTAHEYDLGKLKPGRHVLTVRVDNRLVIVIDIGSDSQVDAAHGGPRALGATTVYWRLETDQRVVEEGEFPAPAVAVGTGVPLGAIEVPFARIDRAAHCQLARLRGLGLLHPVENDWDVWVYPYFPPARQESVKVAGWAWRWRPRFAPVAPQPGVVCRLGALRNTQRAGGNAEDAGRLTAPARRRSGCAC